MHIFQVVKRLLKSAKEEMQRQDIRRKIIVADAEVRNYLTNRLTNRSVYTQKPEGPL